MTAGLRALRRRILTPALSSTSLEVRGFRKKNPTAQELLETVGRSFLEGYGRIVEAPDSQAAEPRLEAIPREFRGFAYEGAAMACSIMDALPGSGGRRLSGLLAGRGGAHTYMAYVGIGWAMARLPRMLHPGTEDADPLLRWLILDGYGFHQAYFHTDRYVRGQHRERKLPWPEDQASYAHRAVDQGIGRALWFVGGTDVDAVLALVDAFRLPGAATCSAAWDWPRPTRAAPVRTSSCACGRASARTGRSSSRARRSQRRRASTPD